MPDILLTTLTARYIHASFGLRCLRANLGNLREQSRILEFEIHQRPTDIAEAILAQSPRIVGLGVYIWNVEAATEVISILKRIRPELIVVLGGPEVSHEWETQEIVALADFLITGEGDVEFRKLCTLLLQGRRPEAKVIRAPPPSFDQLALPYALYDEEDIAHRVLYVEASRGCPFHCEFCLSSLDVAVRQADPEPFLQAMAGLIDRGARHLKFVDRTFNLNLHVSRRILDFCLERYQPGMLFHFEMIPDRLPDALREVIRQFPPGALQFEVGIQTFNEAVAERISRRQDNAKAEANLRWLRQETGVHVHVDLIAGLPGETIGSFGQGFDRLVALQPQEIQIGILKRLRGAPITRHDAEWQMVYNASPPYEILQTGVLDYATVQLLKRFARIWDLTANSGNFVETTQKLLAADPSPFQAFLKWSRWLYAQTHRTDAIALTRLLEHLHHYLVEVLRLDAETTTAYLLRDYQRAGRSDIPKVLRLAGSPASTSPGRIRIRANRRQGRHLAGPFQAST